MNRIALGLAIIGALTASLGVYNFVKSSGNTIFYEQHVLDNWATWKFTAVKSYSNEAEESFRLSVFNDNMKKIQEINSNPEHTFKAGLGPFSDLTEEEFNATLGFKPELHEEDPSIETLTASQDIINLGGGGVDWAAQGGVQPPKDQGSCGSCWAFATIGSLENLDFTQNHTLRNFSEQQLVDCDRGSILPPTPGDNGCHGGLPSRALKYTSWKGVAEQSKYPYKGTEGSCTYSTVSDRAFSNWSYKNISSNSSSALQTALHTGTVPIGIDGSCIQHYTHGIYNDSCYTQMNHAVLVVGYGAGYFKIKNSWSTKWGEEGYFRVAMPASDYNRGYIGMLQNMVQPTPH